MNDLVKTWSVFKRLSMNDKDMQSAFERACRKTNDVIEVLEERDSLQQENDELRAHNQRLRDRLYGTNDYFAELELDSNLADLIDAHVDEALHETPKQSLAKIKADAINQAIMSHRNDESFKATHDVLCCHSFMFKYAASKLEQDNE